MKNVQLILLWNKVALYLVAFSPTKQPITSFPNVAVGIHAIDYAWNIILTKIILCF
jgi:hypothetical protein